MTDRNWTSGWLIPLMWWLGILGTVVAICFLMLVTSHLGPFFMVFGPIDYSEIMGSSSISESRSLGLFKTPLQLQPADDVPCPEFTIVEVWVESTSRTVVDGTFFDARIHMPSKKRLLCVVVERLKGVFVSTAEPYRTGVLSSHGPDGSIFYIPIGNEGNFAIPKEIGFTASLKGTEISKKFAVTLK